MKVKRVLLILIITFLHSCHNNQRKGIEGVDSYFDFSSFDNIEVLKGKKLDMGVILSPVDIFYKDSLLFIATVGLKMNVEIYNCKEGHRKVGSIIGYGGGPSEMLSVARIIFNRDGSFWAHDVVSIAMKRFELNINTDTVFTLLKESFRFEIASVNEPIIINREKFVTTTQDIYPLTRFYEYNMEGERTATKASYPNYKREIPKTAVVDVFSGHIASHPEGNKFVMAYNYTDVIEFYNSSSELVKRVQGPQVFLPEFNLRQRGNNYFMSRVFGETKQAYQAISVSESEIMLLYANGKTRMKGEGEEGIHFNDIVVIDWDGQPINYYKLDHGIATFCVDWETRIIYGLDRIESTVYSFKF